MSLFMAVLGVFVDLTAHMRKPNVLSPPGLTVHIRPEQTDPNAEPESGDQSARLHPLEELSLTDIPIRPQATTPVNPTESPPDVQPVTDWREMITETVATIGKENLRHEALRSSMWQKTHSTLFQPASKIVLKEPGPIIPDFHFKPQVHVAGIGFTIGSCFIGLPLVGVPVEDRTVAIRLFVCAQD